MSHAATYPDADTHTQWRGNGNVRMSRVNKLLLHTTESSSWPRYPNFQPTLTFNPWLSAGHRWRQHLPINGSASTLKNDGTFHTNRADVCQIEIVAYCDPSAYRRYGHGVTAIPDDALQDLGTFLAWIHHEWEVDLFLAKDWPVYPHGAGLHNSIRMGDSGFTHFSGVCGHLHAPGNDHGDPGNLDVGRILHYAKESKPPAPPRSKPTVSLRKVVSAANHDPRRPQGGTTPGCANDVKIVEHALMREGLLNGKYSSDGSFGSLTVAAYAAWQRKCGYTGKDADGIPGRESLTKLGNTHHFQVSG